MSTLKLTSIRLEKRSLAKASQIAKDNRYHKSSEIIRTALWVGLKIVNSRNCGKLSHYQFQEEIRKTSYGLEDVLRTAGQDKEGAR